VVSFVIAQITVVALHYRSTRLDHDTQEIRLARELYGEFYLQEKSYLQIAGAIESCQKLYKNDGGSFGHVAINEYLGFFSDLGLFMERCDQRGSDRPFFWRISSRLTNILKSRVISSTPGRISISRRRSPNSRKWPRPSRAIPASPRLSALPRLCAPTNRKEIHRHDVPCRDCALSAVPVVRFRLGVRPL